MTSPVSPRLAPDLRDGIATCHGSRLFHRICRPADSSAGVGPLLGPVREFVISSFRLPTRHLGSAFAVAALREPCTHLVKGGPWWLTPTRWVKRTSSKNPSSTTCSGGTTERRRSPPGASGQPKDRALTNLSSRRIWARRDLHRHQRLAICRLAGRVLSALLAQRAWLKEYATSSAVSK